MCGVAGPIRKKNTIMNFYKLGLAAPILKALEREGYTVPTPIQAQAIPAVIGGSDLLGIAQTGTGKTAAFALPILNRLAEDDRPPLPGTCRVLVLSPTRELAAQIGESFRVYGHHLGIKIATVFGGVAYRPQIQKLARGVDILVATPGRLLDHVAQGKVSLAETEVFVLDEADQMLDLGFLKPIRDIVAHLPAERQNLFFSATMPREISKLAHDLLTDPVKISVAPAASTVDRVMQRVIHIERSNKLALLAALLDDPDASRALIFTRTKRGADRVARHLEAKEIRAAAIHGNKSQRQREQALGAFRRAQTRVLVATDIAARGIDVEGVSHVVNFDLPEVPEAYVHRIGRTARAGAVGTAVSLCDKDERKLLRSIERLTRQSIPSENRCNDGSLAAGKGNDRQQQGNNGRPWQPENSADAPQGTDRGKRQADPRSKRRRRKANSASGVAKNQGVNAAVDVQEQAPEKNATSAIKPRNRTGSNGRGQPEGRNDRRKQAANPSGAKPRSRAKHRNRKPGRQRVSAAVA